MPICYQGKERNARGVLLNSFPVAIIKTHHPDPSLTNGSSFYSPTVHTPCSLQKHSAPSQPMAKHYKGLEPAIPTCLRSPVMVSFVTRTLHLPGWNPLRTVLSSETLPPRSCFLPSPSDALQTEASHILSYSFPFNFHKHFLHNSCTFLIPSAF